MIAPTVGVVEGLCFSNDVRSVQLISRCISVTSVPTICFVFASVWFPIWIVSCRHCDGSSRCFFRWIRHDSELAYVDSSHVILLCVDTSDSKVLGMLLPLLCVVFFVCGKLGAVELIMGQVHAWMMATAFGLRACYEQNSSSIFVRDDGEPQIVANSLTASFALRLIGPLSRQQIKGSLPVCNILGEPIFMHPPETPKAFEYMESFQFIGWFVPVGSKPTLALTTVTCKEVAVWFPKFMTVQRKDVIEATRYVLVAADGMKTENPSNYHGPSSRVARCSQSMRSERLARRTE